MDFYHFLETELKPRLAKLQPDTLPQWGVMKAQEMVEHLEIPLLVGLNRVPNLQPAYDEERLAKSYHYTFVMRKPMPQNLKVGFISATPPPLKFADLEQARAYILGLAQEFADFWAAQPSLKLLHPAFGMLGAEDWAYFQALHLRHHLTQFDL